jgi:hypothetical protein
VQETPLVARQAHVGVATHAAGMGSHAHDAGLAWLGSLQYDPGAQGCALAGPHGGGDNGTPPSQGTGVVHPGSM